VNLDGSVINQNQLVQTNKEEKEENNNGDNKD
jgi:hypothetical protein